MAPFKNISELEKHLRTLILLKCNPNSKPDIKILDRQVNESLEDKIVQSIFDICNWIADPEILEKYNLQFRVARRNGWNGRGLGHY